MVVVVAELTIVTLCEDPDLGAIVRGFPDAGLAVEGAQAYVPGVGGLRKNPPADIKLIVHPLLPTANPENVIRIDPGFVAVGSLTLILPPAPLGIETEKVRAVVVVTMDADPLPCGQLPCADIATIPAVVVMNFWPIEYPAGIVMLNPFMFGD